MWETRAERGGLQGRQVGVANFGAEAESAIQFLKKRAAAPEEDSREMDAWLRWVVEALKIFRGESCSRLASREDAGPPGTKKRSTRRAALATG